MLLRVANAAALLLLLIVLTQDFQIYAELTHQTLGTGQGYTPPRPGIDASDFFVPTADGQRIHVRRWAPAGPPSGKIRTAILSHGNGGTMSGYYTIPKWLAGQGIASYVYDYRGYGQSSGWPSERGIYIDAEAVWQEAQRRDGATPEATIVFGHSLGGGPSTYLAEKYNMAVLLTAATYTSVPERAALHPLFGRLAPFVRPVFPNRERISRLTDTCLIVLHGHNDDTMPVRMAQSLIGAYRGRSRALYAEHPTAGHGDIIQFVPALAAPLLNQCQSTI